MTQKACLVLLLALLSGCSGKSSSDAPSSEPENAVEAQRQEVLESHHASARLHLEGGDPGGAEADLDQAEMVYPGHPETAFLRGRLRLLQEDPLGAIADFRAAWDGGPDNDAYREGFREALIAAGESFYRTDEFDRAWEVLAEASALESTAGLDYLRGLVAYAWALSTDSDSKWDHLARAEEAFRSVLEEDASNEDAQFNLGAVLLALEQYEEAISLYQDLLVSNPTDGGLYLALSRAHGLMGESGLGLAEEAVGRALSSGETVDNPAAWCLRAADRFPESDLAAAHQELQTPDTVYTYTIPGGALVEVWFYWSAGQAVAFRDGGRVGEMIPIERQ